MAAMSWTCHDHTMIMTKRDHDHAMMTAWRPCFLAWSSWFMVWSWYDYRVSHVFLVLKKWIVCRIDKIKRRLLQKDLVFSSVITKQQVLIKQQFQCNIHVGRVSRGGQRCYCREPKWSRSFTVRRLYWCPGPQELAVVVKLLWIRRSIISVRAEICACRGSRLAFIFSSTNSGENLVLFFSLASIIPASASPAFSSPCADILGCVLESYEFSLLNVLNLHESSNDRQEVN